MAERKMSNDEREKAKEMFDEFSANASEDDVKKIENNLDGMNKGPIAKVWDSVQNMWELIKDTNAAVGSKAIAIGALVYLISPIDAIPDIIPVLGLTDDAAVIALAVAALGTALKKYKDRKNN